MLSDAQYIHAATRRVGLGRVSFISFPLAALDRTDGRSVAAWRQLLGMAPVGSTVSPAAIALEPQQAMQHLLGQPAPAWWLAASLACAYLLFVLIMQLVMQGVTRSRAYSLATMVAVGLCLGLVGWTVVGNSGKPIVGGRISVLDLGPDGHGQQTDLVAYYGKTNEDLSQQHSAWRDGPPAYFEAAEPPQITLQPFEIPQAGVHADGIRRAPG